MQNHTWRGKALTTGCESLQDLLDSLEQEVEFIKECIKLGVEADFSNADDDYVLMNFTDEQWHDAVDSKMKL